MKQMAAKIAKQKPKEVLEAERFPVMRRLSRAALAWSQADLARHAGVNQRTIIKLEQGETSPRRKTVKSIRDVWREYGLRFEVKRRKLILVMSAF